MRCFERLVLPQKVVFQPRSQKFQARFAITALTKALHQKTKADVCPHACDNRQVAWGGYMPMIFTAPSLHGCQPYGYVFVSFYTRIVPKVFLFFRQIMVHDSLNRCEDIDGHRYVFQRLYERHHMLSPSSIGRPPPPERTLSDLGGRVVFSRNFSEHTRPPNANAPASRINPIVRAGAARTSPSWKLVTARKKAWAVPVPLARDHA